MKKILLYIWQLPQILVALVILLWAKATKRVIKKVTPEFGDGQTIYYVNGFGGGISLGEFIILAYGYSLMNGTVEHHEYGHCRQSRMLGWLYLIVIGIPSITWAALHRYDPKRPNSYYTDFYTERWADSLGGITRE